MSAVTLLCGGLLLMSPVDDDPKPSAGAESKKAPVADLSAYEDAKAKAGPDAEAQVRLALWCEAHGLTVERIKHLAAAVLADPANVTARGLMGLVAYKGNWSRPEEVTEKVKADPTLAAAIDEYLQRRAKTADTADAQYKLALWCEENGLSDQAIAHLRRVVRLDPKRELAWKRLGYKKQRNGRWATPAQLAQEKAEADAQKHADRAWQPKLERWRSDLEGKSKKAREAAEAAMAEVSDPRAVPSIISVFAKGTEARQAVAVRLLGQIDTAPSTQSLALLALSGSSDNVRRRATEILRRRDPRDYGSMLASLMQKEIKYQYTPVRGPGQTGTLLVEGKAYDTARRYTPPPLPDVDRLLRTNRNLIWTTDANGLPALLRLDGSGRMGMGTETQGYLAPDGSFAVAIQGRGVQLNPGLMNQNRAANALANQIAHDPGKAAQILAANAAKRPGPNGVGGNLGMGREGLGATGPANATEFDVGRAAIEAERAALAAEQQLENDVRTLERHNTATRDLNQKVADLINRASGQNLKPDPEECRRWAVDQLGYAYLPTPDKPKPTYDEYVPLDYQVPPTVGPTAAPVGNLLSVVRPSHSCFGKGTTVFTKVGPVAIETVLPGDLILTQDAKTGTLSFQAVVGVYHNPPNETLKVAFDNDETIVATGIHRFWKAGQGWAMARELKAGDAIRTIGGTTRVTSVGEATTQPVFNLEVAEGQSFFVGKSGLLVHDNSLVRPVPTPFDAAPNLVAVEGK